MGMGEGWRRWVGRNNSSAPHSFEHALINLPWRSTSVKRDMKLRTVVFFIKPAAELEPTEEEILPMRNGCKRGEEEEEEGRGGTRRMMG